MSSLQCLIHAAPCAQISFLLALHLGSSCFYRSVSITSLWKLSLIHLQVKLVVLEVGLWTSCISITWNLVRNANYLAPPQTY